MTQKIKLEVVDRREFVLGASAAAALLTLGSQSASAKSVADMVTKATGGAAATEGKVKIDMPELAENGNLVPFTISAESAMTDADHVKSIYVFATANPVPDVALARFTPMSGKAEFVSRMRMAKTQDVLAVAVMSDGKAYMSKTQVKVTIGGCGG